MLHRSIANATGLVAGFKSLVVGQFSSTPCSQHLQVLRWSWFCCCCCLAGRKFALLAAKLSRTYSISVCQCLLQLPGSPASAPTPTSTCRYDSSLGKVLHIYCGLHCICGEHVWCNKIAWRRPLFCNWLHLCVYLRTSNKEVCQPNQASRGWGLRSQQSSRHLACWYLTLHLWIAMFVVVCNSLKRLLPSSGC